MRSVLPFPLLIRTNGPESSRPGGRGGTAPPRALAGGLCTSACASAEAYHTAGGVADGSAANADPGPWLMNTGYRRQLPFRSEEHTSELQSRENLVCRLLLE